MIPAKLRNCPECGHAWPQGPDHALRGCGWLYGLPRGVSPSNNELLIHDGSHGRDRFLQFEIKSPRETWPPPNGQLRTLIALARQQNWTVRLLRGSTRAVDLHRITSDGLDSNGIRTHVEAIRKAVVHWLEGSLWRDAERDLASDPDTAVEHIGHTHGFARKDGVWTCVQDQYAIGFEPDTGCGLELPQYP